MKLTDTLKFFTLVVALLALLCIVYPGDGVTVAGATLRFPSLHRVLAGDRTVSMDSLLVKKEERDLSGARDSLRYLHEDLFESQTRFWLPDDDVTFFDRFFDRAEKARDEQQVVRVLHYGDSQIEMDRITCRLRERLQQLFGGGGPGLIPLRQPIPTFSFSQSASGSLVGQSTYGDSTMVRANGNYGPMLRSWRVAGGATLSMRASNNRYAAEGVKQFSSIRVLFNNRPGPLSVSMKDRRGGQYSEQVAEAGIHMVSWQLDSATASATVTLQGAADVYGIMVDNGPGVAVDNISMRGVSGHQFKMANLDQLQEAYAMMNVGMIIMQFGGNSVPYLKGEKSISRYCEQMGEQIDYVHEACPDAVILFIGPSDMSTMVRGQLATYPDLPNIVEQLRKMANEHGAAYWSIYDAMGGQNSMVSWAKNGYAGADYLHFSQKGSDIMGNYICDALQRMYELYKLRRQLTAEQFDKLWTTPEPPTTTP